MASVEKVTAAAAAAAVALLRPDGRQSSALLTPRSQHVDFTELSGKIILNACIPVGVSASRELTVCEFANSTMNVSIPVGIAYTRVQNWFVEVSVASHYEAGRCDVTLYCAAHEYC